MADATPNSYRDPYWTDLASQAEAKVGLPDGLLVSLVTKGERSNADQVSSAGARTPFQITPATRKLVLERDGIDAYLSPENAAEAAALVAKDGVHFAQQRTQDPAAVQRLAAGYYHAGGDTSNWGPKTTAYIARVTGLGSSSKGGSTFSRAMAATEPDQTGSISNVFKAYQSGQMTPEDASDFEAQVNAGHIMLPRNAKLKVDAHAVGGIVGAYQNNQMSPEDAADFESLVKSGDIKVPPGFQLRGQIPGQAPENAVAPPADQPPTSNAPQSLVDKAIGSGEALLQAGTGFVGGSLGAAAGGIGAAVDQAAAGNFGTKAAGDAIEAAAARGASQYTYAPRTASGQEQGQVLSGAMAAALPVMPLTAEMSALTRAAAPVVQMGADAARALPGAALDAAQAIPGRVGGVFRKAETGAPVTAASDIAAVPPEGAPAAPTTSPTAPAAPVAPTVPPVSGEQLAATAKSAAAGSKPATADLAAQAAPDPKVLASAQRLGIEDYLQPDHVSTNQAYRELAQAVKSIPGSEGRAAELQGLSKVAERANQVIDDIGGTTDLSSVDSSVKARLQSSVDNLTSMSDGLYGKVRDAIPPKTEAAPSSTLDFLSNHADELGGADRLLPPEKNLLSKLNGDDGPITYAYLDQTRKQVGQALGKANNGPFADSDAGILSKLYSTLSDDQQAVAEAHGVGNTFQAAKDAVKMRKGIEDDMKSLFGKHLTENSLAASLPKAVRASSAGNTAPLLNILKAVPDDMKQSVVASGVGTAFRMMATKGDISFGTYAKWFEGLQRNRQAFAAVMTNLPKDARRQLIDLYRISNGISAATKERITTGRIRAIEEQFKVADSVVGRLYETAQRSAVGAAVGTVAGHILGPGAGAAIGSALLKGKKPEAIKAVDALIASPEFQRLVKAANTPEQTKAAHAFANGRLFNRFVRSIRSAPDMTNRTRWVLQAMRLPAPQGDNSRNH